MHFYYRGVASAAYVHLKFFTITYQGYVQFTIGINPHSLPENVR